MDQGHSISSQVKVAGSGYNTVYPARHGILSYHIKEVKLIVSAKRNVTFVDTSYI